MKKYFLLLYFLLFSATVRAETIYVDNTLGADCSGDYSIVSRACSGSDGDAYNTIQEAENVSVAGDNIYLRAGTFREYVLFQTDTGSEGNPITYSNYNSEEVILKFPLAFFPWTDAGANPLFEIAGAATPNYLVFSGLEFDGENRTGDNCDETCQIHGNHSDYFAIGNSEATDASAYHITVNNCNIHNFEHAGIKGCFSYVITNNIIHDIGLIEKYDHGMYLAGGTPTVKYNYIYNISGHGIQIYGDTYQQVIIAYNITQHTGLSGVTDRGGLVIQADDAKIYNNIFNDGYIGIFTYGVRNGLDVRNNIFMNNATADLYIGNAGSYDAEHVNTFEYNIMASTNRCTVNHPEIIACDGYEFVAGYDDVPPNISTDPSFTVPSPDDWSEYIQSSGSSGIDTGADLGTSYADGLDPSDNIWPPSTIDQDSFGSGWEIGPFVYRGIGHRPLGAGGSMPVSSEGHTFSAEVN